MSYIDKNLMQGETVCHRARLHWFIFLKAILLASLALGLLLIAAKVTLAGTNRYGLLIYVPGAVAALFAAAAAIEAMVIRSSTELAVTTKRVIVKTGFIRRNTIELNHSKVESFHVEQGIMGRIFGYGTLAITGTGGGITPVANISDPLGFRKHAMEVIDTYQKSL